MGNKVTFGLKNVYYATITESVSGGTVTVTYGTPAAITGAVNLSLSPSGELQSIAADDDANYVTINGQNGYTGNVTFYQLPETFLTSILGYVKNTDNVIYKKEGTQNKPFALLYEIGGDAVPTAYVLYKCVPGEFELTTQTNENTVTPNPINIPITVSAAADTGIVKAYVEKGATAGEYESWNSAVYVPTGVTRSIAAPSNTRSATTTGGGSK